MIFSRNKLANVVGWLGFSLGLTVAIAGPAGFFAVSYTELSHELRMLAELKATKLAKYIYVHQEMWQYHSIRLAELIEVREADEGGGLQRVFDAAGKLVLETGTEPAFPTTRGTAPIVVAGARIATVETSTTFRPLLVETAVVGAFSFLLGFAVFFIIRILPMRAIDRTMGELEATQARYRMLFDANPFPMAVIDIATDRILAVNDVACVQYGWSREEFLSMVSDELYLPEDMPALRAARAQKIKERGAIIKAHGLRHRKKDGSVITVELSSRPLRFGGVPALLVMSQDVTERNRIERERRETEAQLRQSQKMEAVGQLTGGIAHDFNNILTVIMANMEALDEDEGLSPPLQARVKGIGGAVDRAADLTRQLLSFSRKQPLRPQVTDINELLTATGKLLRRSLGAEIEIESVFADDLWPVCIDRSQLETALVNLCVNARDAMPGGGKLLIETRNATLDEDYARRTPEVTAGEYALLSVTDTGTGMAPDVAARIFEPFYTTKEEGKGTGLGLSMIFGFIKQSKGHVSVYSELGRGTTFRLYLPRTEEVAAAPALRPGQEAPRGTERILVVEDEPSVRANTVAQLRSLGYTVDQAEDGQAGLAALEAASLPYDLILTDVMMPRMGGKEMAAAMAGRWPATKIVFMSGYAETAIVNHGTIDKGVLLLSKPFRKVELANVVRKALSAAPVASA